MHVADLPQTLGRNIMAVESQCRRLCRALLGNIKQERHKIVRLVSFRLGTSSLECHSHITEGSDAGGWGRLDDTSHYRAAGNMYAKRTGLIARILLDLRRDGLSVGDHGQVGGLVVCNGKSTSDELVRHVQRHGAWAMERPARTRNDHGIGHSHAMVPESGPNETGDPEVDEVYEHAAYCAEGILVSTGHVG